MTSTWIQLSHRFLMWSPLFQYEIMDQLLFETNRLCTAEWIRLTRNSEETFISKMERKTSRGAAILHSFVLFTYRPSYKGYTIPLFYHSSNELLSKYSVKYFLLFNILSLMNGRFCCCWENEHGDRQLSAFSWNKHRFKFRERKTTHIRLLFGMTELNHERQFTQWMLSAFLLQIVKCRVFFSIDISSWFRQMNPQEY